MFYLGKIFVGVDLLQNFYRWSEAVVVSLSHIGELPLIGTVSKSDPYPMPIQTSVASSRPIGILQAVMETCKQGETGLIR